MGRNAGYWRSKPSCTAGPVKILIAGSMICSCATRRQSAELGWKALAAGLSQQPGEAEDSLIRESPVRAGAVLTTTGRPGTARRGGSGKRDEKVHERNQRVKLRKRRADSNLADLGRYAVHARRGHGPGDSVAGMDRPAGRPWGKPAAYPWRGGRGLAWPLPRPSAPGGARDHSRVA